MGIVIFANKHEYTVVKVMDYLFKNSIGCLHVNEDDKLKILKVSGQSEEFKVVLNGRYEINIFQSVLWNRNSSILLKCLLNNYLKNGEKKSIKQFYYDELTILSKYILKAMPKRQILGTQISSRLNKLLVLDLAIYLGFNVPGYVVCGDYSYVSTRDGVTKSLSEIYQEEDKYFQYANYCKKVTFNGDEKGSFFPSLVQEKVDKEADVRVFVCRDEMFGCLIYTNSSNLDFRLSYEDKDIRYLPYQLDSKTKNRIIRLMKSLNLDTGSIDFLIDKSAKLYFLEINPEGQFGFLDYYCNYGIADRIGERLTQMYMRKDGKITMFKER